MFHSTPMCICISYLAIHLRYTLCSKPKSCWLQPDTFLFVQFWNAMAPGMGAGHGDLVGAVNRGTISTGGVFSVSKSTARELDFPASRSPDAGESEASSNSAKLAREVFMLRTSIADRLAHMQQEQMKKDSGNPGSHETGDHRQHMASDTHAGQVNYEEEWKGTRSASNFSPGREHGDEIQNGFHRDNTGDVVLLKAAVAQLEDDRARLANQLVRVEMQQLSEAVATATCGDMEAHAVVEELCEQLLHERLQRLRCLEIVRDLSNSLSPAGATGAAKGRQWDRALAKVHCVLQDACDEWDAARADEEEDQQADWGAGGKKGEEKRQKWREREARVTFSSSLEEKIIQQAHHAQVLQVHHTCIPTSKANRRLENPGRAAAKLRRSKKILGPGRAAAEHLSAQLPHTHCIRPFT